MTGPAAPRGEQAPEARISFRRDRRNRLPVVFGIAFALAAAAAAAAIYRPYAGGIDDADITFVYARNIADGHGFVYNVGGERVEGSTSLLWTLVCAAVFRLGGSEPALWGACLAMCALAQVLALRMLPELTNPELRRRPAGPWIGLYLVMVFSSTGYVTWMTAPLMDVTLWGTLLTAAVGFVVCPPRSGWAFAAAGGVWFLLCLTRPDAILLAPVLAVLAAWRRLHEGVPAAVRTLLGLGGATALGLGGVTLFRLAYFGWPLPNTYYAKVSASRWHNLLQGTEYVASWLISSPIAACGAATALGILVVRLRAKEGTRPAGLSGPEALAYAASAVLAVPLATGGDHFWQHRFMQPAYPLLCLSLVAWCRNTRVPERCVVLAAGRSARPGAVRGAASAAAVILLISAQRFPWFELPYVRPVGLEFKIAREGRALGERLTRLFADEPLPSVGLIAAGGLARTYPGEKIDVMGLNNVRMGHSPADRSNRFKNHAAFDPDIFLELAPTIFVLELDRVEDFKSFDYKLRNILSDPRFRAAYDFGTLRRTDAPLDSVRFFYRRTWLDELRRSGRFEFLDDPVWNAYRATLDPVPAVNSVP